MLTHQPLSLKTLSESSEELVPCQTDGNLSLIRAKAVARVYSHQPLTLNVLTLRDSLQDSGFNSPTGLEHPRHHQY